jgi:hypothetical protein
VTRPGTSPSGSSLRGSSGSASLGVARRLARAPGAWLAGLLLLAAAAYTALGAVQAARLRHIPSEGLVIDGDRVVSADARWPALRPGDQIVAIAGHAYAGRTALHRMAEVPVAGEATLTIDRDGQRFDVPAADDKLPALHGITMWVRYLVGVLTFLLGAVGFALRPGTRVGWLFYLFCLALGMNLLFPIALAPWLFVFPVVQALAFGLSTSFGVHSFLEMPRRLPAVERRPWLPALLYVPAVLQLGAVVAAPPGPLTDQLSGVWSLIGCVLTLVILGVGLRRARAAPDERLAAQYRVLLVGVTLGLVVPVIVHVARSVTGLDDKWLVHLNALPTIIYPAAITYALLKQNVLGADRYTAVVVAYAATLALIGGGCAAVLVGLPLALYGRAGVSPMVLVVVTAVASFSVGPLYRRLKRAVDRRFQRDAATPAQLTAGLREVVKEVAGGDREAALVRSFAALRAFGAERVALYVLDPARGQLVRQRFTEISSGGSGGGEPSTESAVLPADGALAGALRLDAPGGVDAFAAAPLPREAQDELWALGLALCAAVPVRGVVGGMLAVGPRVSGSRYDTAEQSHLALVAAQIGLLLERAGDSQTVGRYRLERRLGVGGMAEVHLAWQVGPGGFERRVALKRPLPHISEDPELVAMFLDEARLAANLRHACIAQVLEVGHDGGNYFIAMEFVDGVSLRTALRSAGSRPVPIPRALAVVDSLLRALEAAHGAVDARGRALRLVHRDVTPGNLLLSADGDVKLVDFGVALAAARLQVTRAGMVKGTPAYMSPEQAAGRAVDHRSDLFSAAVVFHELLVGRPPWPDGPPVKPTMPPAASGVAPPLAAFLGRALAWEPDQRFTSAEEMRHALLVACTPTTPAPRTDLADWVTTTRAATTAARATVEDPTLPALAARQAAPATDDEPA